MINLNLAGLDFKVLGHI